MKNQRIALRLDNPCHEKWSEMTPSQQGRFCSSCKKHVVDVTTMTDNEMLNLVSQNPQGFCGQFRPDQLNRTLIETQLNGAGSRLNAFVAGIMIAVGAGTASAQSVPHNTVQTQVIDEKHPTGPVCIRDTPSDSVPQTISVFVHADSIGGMPLQTARVLINGTDVFAYTDSTGKATLTIPAGQNADSVAITVSYIGYYNETAIAKASSTNESCNVAMREHYYVLGGAVSIIDIQDAPKPDKKKRKQ